MKNICQILTVSLLVMTSTFAVAQNINVFNYQAVAHDAQNDTVLRNKLITVDFYIGTDNLDPTNNFDYSEEHQLTTNNYGLFNVQIGNEDPQQFEALEWVNESYYLTITIDNELISSQLIVAVPHAIYAQKASEAMNSFMVNNLSVESDVPPNANFTDNQTLSLSSDSLIISDGNAIAINDLNSPDNDWTVTGNNIENANSGKVGIGNTTLFGKLNITTDANTTRGLYVINSTNSNGSGIAGEKMGVYAMVDGSGSGDNTGAWFDAAGTATGINIGVAGYASGTAGENRGVYGAATNGPVNWAGYFDGNVKVNNDLVVGSITNNGGLQLVDGNQGPGKVLRSDAQGNAQWTSIGALAAGVMVNPIYDTNTNGIVDNAELVNGYQVNTNVPGYADFTDNQTLSISSDSLIISNGNAIAIDDLSSSPNLSINDLNDGFTDGSQNLYLFSSPNGTISGNGNIAIGSQALNSNSSGNYNVAIGANALSNDNGSEQTAIGGYALSDNTTGNFNNAVGYYALKSNTSGSFNNAVGYAALSNNSTGSQNTAVGQWALNDNNTGDLNTAVGKSALANNTTGNINTAVGAESLNENSTGTGNTAFGYLSLRKNTIGNENTSLGQNNLSKNTTGGQNTAIGSGALSENTVGSGNVALGLNSMYKSVDGASNTGVGYGSLFQNINGSQNATLGENSLENNLGSQNTAVGALAGGNQTNSNQNTFLGYNANTSSASVQIPINNSTAVGANTVLVQSNSVILGNNADVGIGTSSPTQRLDVDGAIRMRAGPYSSGDIISAGPDGTMIWTSPDSLSSITELNDLSDGYTDAHNNLLLSANQNYNLSSDSHSNTAVGNNTLQNISSGYGNTAFGFGALSNNGSGNTNTAVGLSALSSNSSGNYNTAVGEVALQSNTDGEGNVAMGHKSMEFNNSGGFNVAIGSYSLSKNINAYSNVAIGERALDNNSSGQENVAIGRHTLTTNETGNQNTAIGHGANVGFDNLSNATAIGAGARVDTSNALILGNNANVGIGTSIPGHNYGAKRYLTLSSGNGLLNSGGEATSLELIGGTTTGDLQNRIDFIARATDGNNYTTGRIEMIGSYDVSASSKYGIMRFHTKAREAGGNDVLKERMSIDNYGKITFGNNNNSYYFPTSRGNDGQVLSMSHTTPGELEWTNPTSSLWDVNGSNISRPSGYVGIGTSSPSKPLHVKRVANAEAKIESSSGLARLMIDGSVNKAAIDFYDNGTLGGTMGYSVTSDYLFWTESGHGTILVGKSGNIGIGNSSPSTKLEVTGNTKLDGDVTVGNLSGTGERNVIVDASGKLGVAATNKVAFFTGLSNGTNQTFSGSSPFTVKLPEGSSSFNDGGGYDTGSGYFTAPADGTYQINVSLQVFIPTPQYAGLLQLVLRHAGGKFGEAVESVASSDGASTYINISMSQTIKLSSGQSIWLEMYSSQDDGNIDNWSSSFSGHLIH